jgi:hypothetical protein
LGGAVLPLFFGSVFFMGNGAVFAFSFPHPDRQGMLISRAQLRAHDNAAFQKRTDRGISGNTAIANGHFFLIRMPHPGKSSCTPRPDSWIQTVAEDSPFPACGQYPKPGKKNRRAQHDEYAQSRLASRRFNRGSNIIC